MTYKISIFILVFLTCPVFGQIKTKQPKSTVNTNIEDKVLIKSAPIKKGGVFSESKSSKIIEENAELEGPANLVINPADNIQYDYDLKSDIFNTYIYRDANKHSGYFYYVPNGYYLQFSAETGKYDININYNSADASMARATITATLHPKVNRNELNLTKEILKKDGLKELVSMPMQQKADILFDNVSQFGIDEGDISIRAPSDPDSPILLSFSTDNIDELMTMFFNNIGLYGSVVLYPEGEDMPMDILIPFQLKIDDPQTLGAFVLNQNNWRRDGWENKTDYPVILEAFNILKKDTEANYKVYTWTMGDAEVPEKATVKFNGLQVPRWIDNNTSIKKIWMEYAVLNCKSCDADVKNKIIGGVSGSMVRQIEFDVLTPLEFTGAEFIKIKLKSVQADPERSRTRYMPSVRIEEDGATLAGGQLFVPVGESPNFEFQIQVIMPDGEKHESGWIKSSDTDVIIGKKQIEDYIGAFE